MNSPSPHDSLIEFVYHECQLLDDRRFDDWYALFADDGVYWIPTVPGQTDRETQASIALEDKLLLKLRIERFGHRHAHSLRPQVRSMHVLQQPRLHPDAGPDGLPAVSCNLMYLEYQAGRQLVLGARAGYRLRQTDEGLRIVEKKVELLNMDSALPAFQLFI